MDGLNTLITGIVVMFVIYWSVYFITTGIKISRIKKSGIKDIDKMSGSNFEFYLAQLYKSRGYSVKITPGSGDYGADLLITKNKEYRAIQAKRYNKPVGVRAVQEVIAAKVYYECNAGTVISNNNYTKNAITMANKTGIELIGRNELMSMIIEMKNTKAG
ncbi:restriction endonuclease [Terribacillus saccharophilus]|uniref:restriction endonuclease n=1 Tax=Terribacillus saccharophilus TaxID=361277 RepID=UPI003825D73D